MSTKSIHIISSSSSSSSSSSGSVLIGVQGQARMKIDLESVKFPEFNFNLNQSQSQSTGKTSGPGSNTLNNYYGVAQSVTLVFDPPIERLFQNLELKSLVEALQETVNKFKENGVVLPTTITNALSNGNSGSHSSSSGLSKLKNHQSSGPGNERSSSSRQNHSSNPLADILDAFLNGGNPSKSQTSDSTRSDSSSNNSSSLKDSHNSSSFNLNYLNNSNSNDHSNAYLPGKSYSPALLADILGATYGFTIYEQQQILEQFDIKKRLQIVLKFLQTLGEAQRLSKEIHKNLVKRNEKEVREAIIRRQIDDLRRELRSVKGMGNKNGSEGPVTGKKGLPGKGQNQNQKFNNSHSSDSVPDAATTAGTTTDTDDLLNLDLDGEEDEDEVQVLRQKLIQAQLPLEVKKVARRELQKLSNLQSHHPEFSVSRSYLECLSSLPWNKQIPDNSNSNTSASDSSDSNHGIKINRNAVMTNEERLNMLRHASQILEEDHYGLYSVKKRVLEFLAVKMLRNSNQKNSNDTKQQPMWTDKNLKSNNHNGTSKPEVIPYPSTTTVSQTSNLQPPQPQALTSNKPHIQPQSPILCLLGPPGVGKTSLGKSIARSMGRQFQRVSLGGVRDEAELRGHRRTYIGSMCGVIIQAIQSAGSNNPVILLDEIDKLGGERGGVGASGSGGGNPQGCLLEILDPEQNGTYKDHYLNVPFSLQNVFFICTANDLSTIDRPLRDRLEILELSGYSIEEKVSIAQRYLLPKQRVLHALEEAEDQQKGLAISNDIQSDSESLKSIKSDLNYSDLEIITPSGNPITSSNTVGPTVTPIGSSSGPLVTLSSNSSKLEISKAALIYLITKYTAESGVRSLERRIAQVCRWVAFDIVSNGNRQSSKTTTLNQNTNLNHSNFKFLYYLHSKHDVKKICGLESNRSDSLLKDNLPPGVSIGLAVTFAGGEILLVESSKTKNGSGQVQITGQLGDVMKESVRASLSLLKPALMVDPSIRDSESTIAGFDKVVQAGTATSSSLGQSPRTATTAQASQQQQQYHTTTIGQESSEAETVQSGDTAGTGGTIGHTTVTTKILNPVNNISSTNNNISSTATSNESVGPTKNFLDLCDLHIHFPAAAIPKDGPSAGVATVLALASLFLNVPCRKDTAVTGEITLRGSVLPVGGIKEKILAANRMEGIEWVLIPRANESNVVEEVYKREGKIEIGGGSLKGSIKSDGGGPIITGPAPGKSKSESKTSSESKSSSEPTNSDLRVKVKYISNVREALEHSFGPNNKILRELDKQMGARL